MAQVINTNSLSLITQNNMNKSQSAMSTAIERLSSGLRINSAKDDAAGQAIANRFTSNINGLTQAARNANDGISIAQTTEGSLSEINNNLQRIRELTVQAQNGTNSQSDLDSIQDEITSRLSEIDRVSGQTQFNGVKVLASDNTLKIQVGSNDGETVAIDLKKITSETLGLNGFNVNGSGTVTNKAATVSNVIAAGGTQNGDLYDVTTTNTALTTDVAFSKLNDGDKVTVDEDGTGTTSDPVIYTYNKASDSFTTEKTAAAAAATGISATELSALGLTDSLKAAPGKTESGTWTTVNGTNNGTVKFDTDSTGNITIGGAQAYIDTEGNLTTNNAGTTVAKMEDLIKIASSSEGKGGTLNFKGTEYTIEGGTAADADATPPVVAEGGSISYKATVSKDVVLNASKGAAATTTVNMNSGVLNAAIHFTKGESDEDATNNIDAMFVDSDGEITTVETYTISYAVDQDNGAVTVAGFASTGTGNSDKYKPEMGATVNVNTSGKLTTDTTSAGTVTKDPLAALDAAISSIDEFRSSLGAIQNRLDSAVTNLNNTTTNLSAAQSRIQDADYAVEVSNMSKAQIVQQAGNSVLAKANQVPQQILSLLQG